MELSLGDLGDLACPGTYCVHETKSIEVFLV